MDHIGFVNVASACQGLVAPKNQEPGKIWVSALFLELGWRSLFVRIWLVWRGATSQNTFFPCCDRVGVHILHAALQANENHGHFVPVPGQELSRVRDTVGRDLRQNSGPIAAAAGLTTSTLHMEESATAFWRQRSSCKSEVLNSICRPFVSTHCLEADLYKYL